MNLDVVDGGLYLEFSKCLRIYLLNIEDDDDILFFWLLLIIFKFMFLEKFCVKKNL